MKQNKRTKIKRKANDRANLCKKIKIGYFKPTDAYCRNNCEIKNSVFNHR